MWLASLIQFWGIALDPTIDRRVVDRKPPLSHHFFQVPVAQSIAEVPSYAQENNVGLEMTPFE